MMRRVAVVVAALLAVAAPATARPVAVAPSITLDQSAVALGDWVTFSVVVPKHVRQPRVQVWCYQDDVLVYATAENVVDDSAAFELGGGSSAWRDNGGPADCSADLFQWRWLWTRHMDYVVYASTTFTAAG